MDLVYETLYYRDSTVKPETSRRPSSRFPKELGWRSRLAFADLSMRDPGLTETGLSLAERFARRFRPREPRFPLKREVQGLGMIRLPN
jgi:hypothetical protein